jgi:hypothetical protein
MSVTPIPILLFNVPDVLVNNHPPIHVKRDTKNNIGINLMLAQP